jgi:hypothetical protein
MNTITLNIPDRLMNQLQGRSETIECLLLKALEDYLQKESFDIRQTKTWELCGSLVVPNPEPKFIVENGNSELSTNYSERIDEVLY